MCRNALSILQHLFPLLITVSGAGEVTNQMPSITHNFSFIDNNLAQIRFTIPQSHIREPELVVHHFRDYFSEIISGEMSRMQAVSVGVSLVFTLEAG